MVVAGSHSIGDRGHVMGMKYEMQMTQCSIFCHTITETSQDPRHSN